MLNFINEYKDIIVNVVSIISIALFLLSVQFKKKKDILIVQTLSSICYMIVYAILGALSGCIIELVEQSKNLVFIGYEKKNKEIPLYALLVFIFMLVIITIFTYDGWNSAIPLAIYILYFLSSYFKNPKHIRTTMILCAMIWMVYNYTIGAKLMIIGNVLEIISAIVSLIRYDMRLGKKKSTKKKQTEKKIKKGTK